MKLCSNCGLPARGKNGTRCGACGIYWWRHQTERPPDPVGPVRCGECGAVAPRPVRGRCHRCYSRYYRHATAHYTPRRYQTCAACGAVQEQTPSQCLRRGYCQFCYQRRLRRGDFAARPSVAS